MGMLGLTSLWKDPVMTAEERVVVADVPAAHPDPTPDATELDPQIRGPLPDDRFLDRELSWLAFNQRVLELAEDQELPALDRAKFVAIFASNLDEFFMVRVAGLKRRIATGIAVRAASGLTAREVLDAIWQRAHQLELRQAELFMGEIVPQLSAEGIQLLRWEDLGDDERKGLDDFFAERVFPVLTPLAVDPSHPFPYISGLSLNLAVVVRNPVTGTELFARVKVPPLLARFVEVGAQRFVPLEDVIAAHLEDLFPGMDVLQHHTFRVTRNEDLEVEEDDAENLLKALERELMRRRFGPPVRLEVEQSIDPHVLDLLVSELAISEEEVFRLPGPLDLTGLWGVYGVDRDDLKQPAFVPKTSRELSEVESASAPDVLAMMRERDVLVHHPYDSFSTSTQLFLEQAARDRNVLAIKQTLYRTSGDSPIVDALIDAAQAGKQVLALVEIKARFDEQNNIEWGRKLEQAGVHVVYGLVGLKTHSKLSMVIRNDGDRLRRYCHVGTGNYHPKTARLYEDFGLLTTDPRVGEDVANLFNVLSGYSMNTSYARLLVAPHSIRVGLIDRIEREVEHHRAGRPARIRFKCNSIVDERIIDALYRASQAGVSVDIWVRGICAVRPGIPGVSDNIRVVSILGRFLEHSRSYEFTNGGDTEVWIGSADLMHRNLDRRVEALVSLQAPEHRAEVAALFDFALDPGTSSWLLSSDGTWRRHTHDSAGQPLADYQETLIREKQRRGRLS
jgi:polyphosphate kinase